MLEQETHLRHAISLLVRRHSEPWASDRRLAGAPHAIRRARECVTSPCPNWPGRAALVPFIWRGRSLRSSACRRTVAWLNVKTTRRGVVVDSEPAWIPVASQRGKAAVITGVTDASYPKGLGWASLYAGRTDWG